MRVEFLFFLIYHLQVGYSGEDSSYSQDDGMSQSRGRQLQNVSPASWSSYSKHDNAPVYGYRPKTPLPEGTRLRRQHDIPEARSTSYAVLKDDFPSLSCHSGSRGSNPGAGKTQVEPSPVEETESCASLLHHDLSQKVNISCSLDKSEPSEPSQERSPQNSAGINDLSQAECQAVIEPFDICLNKIGTPVMLKPSLLAKNREKRNEIKRSTEGQKGDVLRSGMVLLKKYLSLSDQVRLANCCMSIFWLYVLLKSSLDNCYISSSLMNNLCFPLVDMCIKIELYFILVSLSLSYGSCGFNLTMVEQAAISLHLKFYIF